MKSLFAAASLAALLAAAPAWAQTGGAAGAPPRAPVGEAINSNDLAFIRDAAHGSLAEMQMGQLAAEKAQNDLVKLFARSTANSYGFAMRQLTTIAQNYHGEDPAAASNTKADAIIEKLKGQSGAAFDKAYLAEQATNQQMLLTAVQAESQNGYAPLLKSLATNMIPMIQAQQMQVQMLQQAVGGGK